MKKYLRQNALFLFGALLPAIILAQPKQTKAVPEYDTIIRKHVVKPIAKRPVITPVPEYINQPYYYDKNDNRLLRLENVSAQMVTKKKSLGLKGAKQLLTMNGTSSKIRFMARNDIYFIIKTSGDVIDLTSYIKLYRFVPGDQKRDVTITAKEGLVKDKDEARGKPMSFNFKMISKDNYMLQIPEQLEAGEYGFVWVKNMDLDEFTVFAFGIDWKNSD